MVAYLKSAGTKRSLEVGTIQALPVEVVEVVCGDSRFPMPNALLLPGKPADRRIRFQLMELPAAEDTARDDPPTQNLVVRYRLLGMDDVREVTVIPHQHLDVAALTRGVMRQEPNASSFPFLQIDQATRSIEFAGDHVRVDQNLIIPPGYTVKCGPGVVIDLVAAATIVCYSAIDFQGDEDAPIIITSSDRTGQGLAVFNANLPSHFRHVVVRQLSTPAQEGWELTGAVTFFHSPVVIENCEFTGNDSEDGLNIVSSEFKLHHTHFEASTSDALDGDFTSGEIRSCTFHNIGGDAIDFSGSRVEVENVRMTDIADKGLSVGEDSVLFGKQIQIANAKIGAAAKDLSTATLADITIENSRIALAVFRKKPEFGLATMHASDIHLNNNDSALPG